MATVDPKLDALKVGDRVMLVSRGWSRRIELHTIHSKGKLYVTFWPNGLKYSLVHGYRVGWRYSGDFIKPYDEKEWLEYKQDVSEKKHRNFVRSFDYNTAPQELIEKIYELLPKTEDK